MTNETNIYSNGKYLVMNPSWHEEDSAWKAYQIVKIIQKNDLHFNSICDIGCGAGEILRQMSLKMPEITKCDGYEISQQAFQIAKQKETDRLNFHLMDIVKLEDQSYDVLLAIDVFEHVPDYISFIQECAKKAKYKIYHIPLDIHVSAVLRSSLTNARRSVGHLHYFTAETALATLEGTGQCILDFCYTDGALAFYRKHLSIKSLLANMMRFVLTKFSKQMAAKLVGGYSLLVLTE